MTRKPSEVFVIKSIVQLIADETGEKKAHPPSQAAEPVPQTRHWDGFFGRG